MKKYIKLLVTKLSHDCQMSSQKILKTIVYPCFNCGSLYRSQYSSRGGRRDRPNEK